METIYQLSKRIYKELINKIKKNNTVLVDQRTSPNRFRVSLRAIAGRSIIPYVHPDPKTKFLTITPVNLFTQDEPVLRYLPSMKAPQPTSIGWFEDTVLGRRPLNSLDSIDKIFLSHRSSSIESKIYYLKSINRAASVYTVPQHKTMEQLFCSTCLIFDCGMHTAINIPPFCKFNEASGCICDATKVSPICYDRQPLSTCYDRQPLSTCYDNTLKEQIAKDQMEKEIMPFVKKSNLSPCITSKIVQLKYGQTIACSSIKFKKFPIKKISTSSKKIIDNKEFFKPCQCKGSCATKVCPCVQNQTSCELSCPCLNCNNMKFCTCIICDERCPCLFNKRECSEICSCKKLPKIESENKQKNSGKLPDISSYETKLCPCGKLPDMKPDNEYYKALGERAKYPRLNSDKQTGASDCKDDKSILKIFAENSIQEASCVPAICEINPHCCNINISDRVETRLSVYPSERRLWPLF